MVEPPEANPGDPGVLYYDPNPTTARLATAGLRLAGYRVHHTDNEPDAVELCRRHGPAGDTTIAALLLDTASSPSSAASLLKALLQVPGAAQLPGILLVSRANPTPIPGAEGLPSLKRPFTTPALIKVVRDTIDAGPTHEEAKDPGLSPLVLDRMRRSLGQHFPDLAIDPRQLAAFTSDLVAHAELPTPSTGVSFQCDLTTTRLESVLRMLAEEGVRGVLTIQQDQEWARLHLDRGWIRLAEIHGASEDLRLGRFVVEAGFMDNATLEAIAQNPDPEQRPLGMRLVEEGYLRRGELVRVLLNLAREVTCHLLTWKRGKLTFSPVQEQHPLAETAAHGRAELRIAEALIEGLRRMEETAEMGPHMAGVDDVFIRADEEVGKLGRNAFTREELGVLELLNGRNSVKEIARKTRTGTFAVAKVLYRLAVIGVARRRMMPVMA